MRSPLDLREIVGVLISADPQTRTLIIDCNGTRLSIAVNPRAEIRLHGQPVRFRLLQSGDRVRVAAQSTAEGFLASAVDAEEGRPLLPVGSAHREQ